MSLNLETTSGIESSLLSIANAIAAKSLSVSVADLSFSAGWSSLNADHAVRAIRYGNVVFLVGIMTKSASWTSGEISASLPVGYRPSPSVSGIYLLVNTPHSTSSSAQSGVLNIYTSSPSTGVAGDIATRLSGLTGNFISLYGISFICE